tara:strand:- start:985 stop:1314 length:330 start_codon:yes stop_codon:yes gene_type:complete
MFGLIPFLFFMSLMLNVGFIYYLSYLLKERSDLRNDFGDLLVKCENYSSQLLQLYELEMFYGDETLENLLNNSRILINDFYEYEDKYFVSENNAQEEEETDVTTEEKNS